MGSKVNRLADTGKLNWSVEYEDVHMNIENALVSLIGDVGKKSILKIKEQILSQQI